MGHFGRRPIRSPGSRWCCRRCCSTTSARARCCCAIPRAIDAARSTSWRPTGRSIRWSLLATVATVIASQAVISGAFSLTRQAVQLGCCRACGSSRPPRRDGQIYMPARQLAADGRDHRPGARASVARATSPRPTASPISTRHGDHDLLAFFVATRWGWTWRRRRLLAAGVPGRRPGVLRRQPGQDRRRRLVSAARGRRSCSR